MLIWLLDEFAAHKLVPRIVTIEPAKKGSLL
jgi:hypothetical protein